MSDPEGACPNPPGVLLPPAPKLNPPPPPGVDAPLVAAGAPNENPEATGATEGVDVPNPPPVELPNPNGDGAAGAGAAPNDAPNGEFVAGAWGAPKENPVLAGAAAGVEVEAPPKKEGVEVGAAGVGALPKLNGELAAGAAPNPEFVGTGGA